MSIIKYVVGKREKINNSTGGEGGELNRKHAGDMSQKTNMM